jgi:4-hydroxy-tetrahydrodipicolinate reductase
MIKILVVGLPGNMATTFTKKALNVKEIEVVQYSITGEETEDEIFKIEDSDFKLIKSNDRKGINQLFSETKPTIVVDYTEPQMVEKNIDLYCRKGVHFIMGTTGVVINKVSDKIKESNINAIIAPNMGKQVVALQAMMKYAADNFPNCFKDYTLRITESHQKGKLDTSGTARAMVEYFKQLGIPFDENEIIMYRDPVEQIKLGVSEKYLNGHGWHTYTFISSDKSVYFEITHNVNGREIYANGTIDSIFYLNNKIKEGVRGATFTMIDVMKNM